MAPCAIPRQPHRALRSQGSRSEFCDPMETASSFAAPWESQRVSRPRGSRIGFCDPAGAASSFTGLCMICASNSALFSSCIKIEGVMYDSRGHGKGREKSSSPFPQITALRWLKPKPQQLPKPCITPQNSMQSGFFGEPEDSSRRKAPAGQRESWGYRPPPRRRPCNQRVAERRFGNAAKPSGDFRWRNLEQGIAQKRHVQ